MDHQNLEISQANNANRIVISKHSSAAQMLAKICRNDQMWLSPVGWTEDEKGTLLDCYILDGQTHLEIPTDFAAELKAGDAIKINLPEWAVTKELKWAAVTVAETQDVSAMNTQVKPSSSGLLSRLSLKKSAPVTEEVTSETQQRANEAARIAEDYKAKMQAAEQAKAVAQAKALAAAKEAEKALALEMKQMAEMERAAKAFEEAERLRQDELRRLEEERRIEEERKAEEARRIEEARQREIAKREAEAREAAILRYEGALEVTEQEKINLSDRLKTLRTEAKDLRLSVKAQAANLENIQQSEVKFSTKNENAIHSLEKEKAKLIEAETTLSAAKVLSEEKDALSHSLSIRRAEAEVEYASAQRAVEEAMVIAKQKKEALARISDEVSLVQKDADQAASVITAHQEALGEQQIATEQKQTTKDHVEANLSDIRGQLALVSDQLARANDNMQNLNLQIEATQQAIEDLDMREGSHRAALAHLRNGGDLEKIGIEFKADLTHMPAIDAPASRAAAALKQTNSAEIFANMTEEKVSLRDKVSLPKFSLPKVSVPKLSAPKIAVPKFTAPKISAPKLPELKREHGVAALAILAVLGLGAIVGLAVDHYGQTDATIQASVKPAPSEVASAVVREPAVKSPVLPEIEAATTETDITDADKTESAPDKSDEAEIEKMSATNPADAKAVPEDKVDVEDTPKPILKDVSEVKAAKKPAPKAEAVKLAEVKAIPKEITAPAVVNEAPKTQPAKPETAENSDESEKRNYPELTRDVQVRLQKLGFYEGPIDGEQTEATQTAIAEFKALFGLAETTEIDGTFLRELRNAGLAKEETVQVAEATPVLEEPVMSSGTVEIYAAPTEPVAETTLAPVTEPEPVVETATSGEATAEPVQTAEVIIAEPETPVITVPQDEIIDAKMIENAAATYPSVALRRQVYVNTVIEVYYDIDTDGNPVNIRIKNSEYDGRYASSFEKEAIDATKKQKFEPKRINGQAVVSEDNVKRVVFRTQ